MPPFFMVLLRWSLIVFSFVSESRRDAEEAALAVAFLSLETSLDQALREGFFDADGLASLPDLFHDAPIVRVFGGNAKRFECPLVAISGHTAGTSRTSALPPIADIRMSPAVGT